MDDYLGRAQALLISLTGLFRAGSRPAQHLSDLGVTAEGVLYLAWGITNGDRFLSLNASTGASKSDGLVAGPAFRPDRGAVFLIGGRADVPIACRSAARRCADSVPLRGAQMCR